MNYFPQDWKAVTVITIPKPGKDHQLPENHIPISLLPTFLKILERIVLTELRKDIEHLKLLYTSRTVRL